MHIYNPRRNPALLACQTKDLIEVVLEWKLPKRSDFPFLSRGGRGTTGFVKCFGDEPEKSNTGTALVFSDKCRSVVP